MPVTRLLIANRGEIAIRIARAAAELGIQTLAIFAEDDATSLHTRQADQAAALKGRGASAYLDQQQIIDIARTQGCDAVHPGYGFLSENAGFARHCEDAGLTFVGPSADVLDVFGDKARARDLARDHGVALAAGSNSATLLEDAERFFRELPAGAGMMIKALAGGGGRGMRAVRSIEEITDAYARCQAEARAAFGDDRLYVERLIQRARHIEVQVIGDGRVVSHLGERDCTLQRRNQKLLEIAPSPNLHPRLRGAILAAAVRLAEAVDYRGLGTFEFLLDEDSGDFVFMEANPRLQVEHTITEAVTGIDLVQAQLRIAAGASLAELNLTQAEIPAPRGHALQLRINLESLASDGTPHLACGTLSAYEPPSGPGLRVDGYGYAGYRNSAGYDSLLAKLIVHGNGGYPQLVQRAYRALCEFRLEGVASNIPLLLNLLRQRAVADNQVTTRYIEEHLPTLLGAQEHAHPHRFFSHAGVSAQAQRSSEAPAGCIPLAAPGAGVLVSLSVATGDGVAQGQTIAVVEAMKMEFEVKASASGIVHSLAATPGDSLGEGDPLLFVEPADIQAQDHESSAAIDLDAIRADLAEVLERHAIGLDERRPDAVAKRHRIGKRTTRENLADLLDDGSFIEYGALAIAAQRRRRSVDDLIASSPADGLVSGLGSINAAQFGDEKARCLVLAYDYTVFAGTQGVMNHKKTDRMLHLAEQWRIPLVLYAEGGGGRPGDTDFVGVAGLDNMSFVGLARLSGLVPLVGVVSGRCFAGNAALLGCCDVIIATRDTSLGMAGPAMIEGGGLGRFAPEEVGPSDVQSANGVIDVLVEDEAEATRIARQYLAYFQGDSADWQCADQRLLRHAVPENRLRVYDIRQVIEQLADNGSVLELRRHFAAGMITALVRIEGKPFGLIANNPMHLGGAIDAEAGDKAARFMQLCDAFDLPIISLCDTPGFMVGPEAEKTGTVRHVSRMFVTAASLSVPFFTVVLRKGYGLGAQAMAAGSFHSALFTVAWPSGEFGAMGLEGAIRLGYAKELGAIEDAQERQKLFDKLVAAAYRNGKGLNMASYLEIDDVIDPADTRRWLLRGLASTPKPAPRQGKKRPLIDTW
ncbi:carbamoyl-phosphate synthase large subunit [Pseudomonas sp. 21]|uniref:acetyl-CoA carboxylase family protein n=1 Tax=unclassified Pseudomonas TaxID=196821 RepID=UPI0005EB9516|nr:MULTISPECIES: carboxyl transferase domain-containing protein [unclassified Pseudomonas]KJJ97137.1 carbamoyl-phosphate synthase large subunit [Pseudomonas sp. 21]MBV7583116.1 carbamoyl-phosphate synthase large subunit [Pseudomonas sp. PDM33]